MIDYDKWNHVDFLWAIDVNRLFNNDLVLFLRDVTETPNFIRSTVIEAFNERLMNPAVDTPLTGLESIEQIPGAAELNKIFKDLPNPNSFSDFADSAKNHFESNVKKVQTGTCVIYLQFYFCRTFSIYNRIWKLFSSLRKYSLQRKYSKNH